MGVRLLERLSRALLVCAACCGITLTGFVALSAIMRYAIGEPFAFTEELVGLLFSALVFLALPYVSVYQRHINISLFTNTYGPVAQRVAQGVANVLIVLFCLWFGYYSFEFTYVSYMLSARTDLADLLVWPWSGLTVVASVLMGAAALVHLLCSGALTQVDDTAGPQGEA